MQAQWNRIPARCTRSALLLIAAAFSLAQASCDTRAIPVPTPQARARNTAPQTPPPDINEFLRQAVLTCGDTELKPVRVRTFDTEEIYADGLILNFQSQTITAVQADSGEPAWTCEAPLTLRRIQIAFAAGVMYVAPIDADDGSETTRSSRKDCRVERLALTDGQWLSPLVVPPDGANEQHDDATVLNGQLLAICPVGDNVVTLCEAWARFTNNNVGQTLTKFDAKTGAVLWSRHFAVDETRKLVNSFEEPKVRRIPTHRVQAAGDLLIASDVPDGTLAAFDTASGETRWQVERIWEYSRVYTGSGIEQVDLRRYGLRDDAKEDWRRQAEEHARLGRGGSVRNVIIVPTDESGDFHIYAAATLLENEPWSELMVEEAIYQVSSSGVVQRMSYVPQGFSRYSSYWDYDYTDNWDVWQREVAGEIPDGMMRLLSTQEGGLDPKTIDFEVFRDRVRPQVDTSTMFSTSAPLQGFVNQGCAINPAWNGELGPDDVTFTINVRNLRTGILHKWPLRIPHDGEFALPSGAPNFYDEQSDITPHQFFLKHAHQYGDRLVLSFFAKSGYYAAEFELTPILRASGATQD